MSTVLIRNESGDAEAFFINDEEGRLAEMIVTVHGTSMTVHHTEVEKRGEGKGIARMLLAAMVAYAREKNLKVVPVCSYVRMQFERNPESYRDILG